MKNPSAYRIESDTPQPFSPCIQPNEFGENREPHSILVSLYLVFPCTDYQVSVDIIQQWAEICDNNIEEDDYGEAVYTVDLRLYRQTLSFPPLFSHG